MFYEVTIFSYQTEVISCYVCKLFINYEVKKVDEHQSVMIP